ncbi:hypothetical protein ACFLR1_07190, partial [Bacteroidota bacterium]
MAKPKRPHKGKPHTPKKVEATQKPSRPGFPLRLAKNVLILIGVLLLLKGLKSYSPGYNWVVESQILNS